MKKHRERCKNDTEWNIITTKTHHVELGFRDKTQKTEPLATNKLIRNIRTHKNTNTQFKYQNAEHIYKNVNLERENDNAERERKKCEIQLPY